MKSTTCVILLLAIALVGVGSAYVYEKVSDSTDIHETQEQKEALALNVIMTRTSVRDFLDKEIPDSLLTKILRAGMAAPSAYNRQPWEFIVVNAPVCKRRISELRPGTTPVAKCQAAIVVCGNMDKVTPGENSEAGNWTLDCAAATENMLLAANALGIGGVWCGLYTDEKRIDGVSDVLELPDNLVPFSVVALGYEATPAMPKEKWDPERVYLNTYDTPFYPNFRD